MFQHITPYIPKMSVQGLHRLIDDENLSIKVVKQRITKHGDFRKSNNQKCIITVNKSNNKYRFLMTLIHEIAHYYTYKENKFAKPHGIKWKTMFKNISKPFLNNSIFPENLLNSLCLGSVQTKMLEKAFPGYKAEVSPLEMAEFIFDFSVNGKKLFSGKVIPISKSNP